MAATLTTALAKHKGGPFVRVYSLAWVAHTDGAVDLDTSMSVVGELARVVFVPGSPAPTAAYDVVLKDEHGLDVLAGQGANLSESAASHVCPGVPLKDGTTTSVRPILLNGILNLEVSAAGSGGAGTIYLYVK